MDAENIVAYCNESNISPFMKLVRGIGMTKRQQLMAHTLIRLSIAVMIGAGPAAAQSSGGSAYYQATLASPAEEKHYVIREKLWTCAGDICTSAENGSRPAIICAAVAKAVGPLRAFAIGATGFDAGQLAKCNDKAS